MTNYEFLKKIFDNAHKGIYNIPKLPKGISRDVVYKNILYIELQNLKKTNTDLNRIAEIEAILYKDDTDGLSSNNVAL